MKLMHPIQTLSRKMTLKNIQHKTTQKRAFLIYFAAEDSYAIM